MHASSAADPANALHDPVALRQAGADLLSLALIDSRNRTLRWLAAFETHADTTGPGATSAAWLAGRAGWWQERWVARHLQRAQGRAAGATPPLASLHPQADDWFAQPTGAGQGPPPDELRAYLQATLEATLELLDTTPAGATAQSAALYPYHQALRHEDQGVEMLAQLAQASGLPAAGWAGLLPEPAATSPRAALLLPATRVTLGGEAPGGGFVPDNETGQLAEPLPDYEIDAQPVHWAALAEFAADGGYDQAALWSDTGWAWAQARQRRAPRHVEQLAGGVLARHRGRLARLANQQPVVHASFHEAQAFARWAGRRLPSEAEWLHAARHGARRGFVWGQVHEWVLEPAAYWPGAQRGPHGRASLPAGLRLLRGASAATVPRQAHPLARRFARAEDDAVFAGFRTCAL
jgi:formylglycine-generating enzyme required for sulfatase activity